MEIGTKLDFTLRRWGVWGEEGRTGCEQSEQTVP